jgi:O-succinylbenzoate synthase
VTQTPKPALAQIIDSARVVSLPMRTRFRGLLERETMLFEGPFGWTEWSPFTEYEDAEAAHWLAAAIDFGWSEPPQAQRTSIGVNATLAAVAAEAVEQQLARFGEFKTVKIKVAEPGQSLEQDLARVRAVREIYPEVRIRLDANGGFSFDAAVELSRSLQDADIELEYFEQPVASVDELYRLRLQLNPMGIRIAADESVRKAEDPLAVAAAGAADLLVLKAAPLGGIRRALEIAEQAGLPWVVSSALESSVGIAMGAHLAALNPNDFDAGLATVNLFAGDVSATPLAPKDGQLPVQRAFADASRLEVFAAEDHRYDWWLERLERCYPLV